MSYKRIAGHLELPTNLRSFMSSSTTLSAFHKLVSVGVE